MNNYKLWLAAFVIIFTGSLLFFYKPTVAQQSLAPPLEPTAIRCVVNNDPSVARTERIGMNLSLWTSWGAEQYQKNILMNPGFNGQVDRILVIVNHFDENSFSDGQGLGQKDGYWNGASFEVRSGPSAGTVGTISKSLYQGQKNLPQYFTDGPAPTLVANDVIVLTRQFDPNPVQQWWIPTAAQSAVTLNDSSIPPNSTSKQSLVLESTDSAQAEIISYLDAISDRAGNLLKVSGPWKFSCWVRGDGESPQLKAYFQRMNDTPEFFTQSFQATPEWQKVEHHFNANDSDKPGILKFGLVNQTSGSKIEVNNIELGPVQDDYPKSAWRADVIEMLKKIRPSYLRDWQGQLADTFENRVSDVFGRKNWTSRLFGGEGTPSFGYSIPDFLELCSEVQAIPWIIIPPTLTDAELTLFGFFLSEQANTTQFPEIVLEFGNENWNWIFRSAGIPIPAAHGPVADRAFEQIKLYAGPDVNIRRVINGQFYNPSLTEEFATTANYYDTMAVAPYFFMSMDQGSSNSANLTAMFKDENPLFKQINEGLKPLEKTLAVYEVNLHTMSGNDSADARNPFVAGAAGGTALAKRLIEGMFNHASPQLVFCFSQFDSRAYDVPGYVKLWGACRDCSPTKRMRPTGLAVQMLNKVAAGSLHKIIPTAKQPMPGEESKPVPKEAENLTLAAFRTTDEWNAVAINVNSKPQLIELEFPEDQRQLPSYVYILDAPDPFASNEEKENVKITAKPIETTDRTLKFTIPAYGYCVFTSDRMEQEANRLAVNAITSPADAAAEVLPEEL